MECIECKLPARYGNVNNSTGRFEKKHCKNHKKSGEIGKAQNGTRDIMIF